MKKTLLALGIAAAILAGCNKSSNSLPYNPTVTPTPFPTAPIGPTPTPSASSTPSATPTPSTTPSIFPAPLSIAGNSNFQSLGQNQIFTVSQRNVPAGTYYTAVGNAGCAGAATIVASPPAATPAPQPPAVAGTTFTITSLLNTTACAIIFTSSADGANGVVTLNIAAPIASPSSIPIQ